MIPMKERNAKYIFCYSRRLESNYSRSLSSSHGTD